MKRGNITITPNRIAVTLSTDETVWMSTEEIKICEGCRCIVEYYNLNMIIALSYRIDTPPSKAFRRWIGERVLRSQKREAVPPLILRIEIRYKITN